MVNKSKGRSKRNLMAIITVLLWLSNYIYVPVFSTYCTSVGASLSMAGMILGSYGLTQMLFRIPIGLLSDILRNRRLFLFFGMGASFLSSLGFYFFTSPGLLLLFRALSGVAASNLAIYITTYAALEKEENSSRSIGIVNSLMALGQILAAFLGGLVAEYISVEATFLVSSISAFIGLILLLFIGETYEPNPNKASVSGFISVFKDKKLLFYSMMALILQSINTSSLMGFIPSIMEGIGASEFEKGLGTTLAFIPAVFAAPLAVGPFSRRFGTKWTAVLGFIILSVPMFLFSFIRSIPLILVLQFVAGFGRGTLMPLFMACSTSHLPSDTRSTALSVNQAIYGLGMWIGPALTGYISNIFSLKAAFIYLGFSGFAAIGCLLIHKDKGCQVDACTDMVS